MLSRRAVLFWLFLTLIAGPAGAEERAAQPGFKGMELYSWSGPDGWRYALLPGTNRDKSWQEVQAVALDEARLRAALARLAVGETVSWYKSRPVGPLAYPPAEVKAALLEEATRLQIQVFVEK